MLLKLIACNVFMREACTCIARTPHRIDVEFTELGEHIHSATLRQTLQAKIDAAAGNPKHYDAILLLFGICGNATIGLTARETKLVVPRAHDCCTILLGSRAKFREHFEACPSMPFSSAGYVERGEYYMRTGEGTTDLQYGNAYAAYVEQYGEENAKYIWDSMHPDRGDAESRKAVFIDLPETAHLGYAEQFRAKAEAEGKEYVRLEGNMDLIRRLLTGDWDPADFLTVEPGQQIAGVYDMTEIIRATV